MDGKKILGLSGDTLCTLDNLQAGILETDESKNLSLFVGRYSDLSRFGKGIPRICFLSNAIWDLGGPMILDQ